MNCELFNFYFIYILFFDIIANADRWVESRMFEKEHEDF